MAHGRCRRKKERAALAWFACFFVAAQLALTVVLEARHPEIWDPEFDVRLTTLRSRVAEEPGRPLLLLLGSSRTEMSFTPETLPPLPTVDGRRPLAFNFSHLGAGPVMNLLECRRLLRRGVRPHWLVIEVMPSQLGDEHQNILTSSQAAPDLSLVSRYLPPWKVYGMYARERLAPWYKQRALLVHQWLPRWLPADGGPEETHIPIGPLGGDFAWMAMRDPSPDLVRDRTAFARTGYYPALQNLHVADISDRAWHELLGLCRRERISVALILTPEGREFQSWYSPQARRLVDDYSAKLSAEYGAPLIDARNWLGDDAFVDSHHVTLRGAEAFTQRLGREALQPLVEGKLSPSLRPILADASMPTP